MKKTSLLIWSLFFIVYGFGLLIFQAFLFSEIWDWFVVPLLHLPVLTVASACGIILMFNFIRRMFFPRKSDEMADTINKMEIKKDEECMAAFGKMVEEALRGTFVLLGFYFIAMLAKHFT